jgi:acetylornithine/succinyldiaminopimelate/putrescine aminotransferase
MGAVLLTDRVASTLRPGDHATTFGGGPLVASAALAAVKTIGDPEFLAGLQRRSHALANHLQRLVVTNQRVKDVRGVGMIWGIDVEGPAADVVARAMEAGLLLCTAGPSVVRLVPPLVVSEEELARGVDILDEVI